MDETSKLFDVWANTGRSEEMEKGHGTTVNQFLDKLPLKENFRFLDIGCGNGWVVRKMSQKNSCIKAIGIDKSKMMIKNAKSKISSKKESYFVTELESWDTKEKFDVIWEPQGSDIRYVGKLSNRSLNLLEKSGCSRLTFGIESGSKRILNLINKNISEKKVLDLNKKLSPYKMLANYNLMSGFPTETLDDLRKTVNLLLKLLAQNKNAAISNVLIYTPYPGTDLYPLTLQQGLVQPEVLRGWINYNTDTVNLPWISKERKNMPESLFICSLFMDDKYKELNSSKIIKFSFRLYKLIAKARIKNMFFRYMIEKRAYNLAKSLIQKQL